MRSCVAVQFCRRVSSGCADVMVVVVEDEAERLGCSDERSVSGRPGAEGAPRSRSSRLPELLVDESLLAAVLVVLVGCDAGGAMRRDWIEVSGLVSHVDG